MREPPDRPDHLAVHPCAPPSDREVLVPDLPGRARARELFTRAASPKRAFFDSAYHGASPAG